MSRSGTQRNFGSLFRPSFDFYRPNRISTPIFPRKDARAWTDSLVWDSTHSIRSHFTVVVSEPESYLVSMVIAVDGRGGLRIGEQGRQ